MSEAWSALNLIRQIKEGESIFKHWSEEAKQKELSIFLRDVSKDRMVSRICAQELGEDIFVKPKRDRKSY